MTTRLGSALRGRLLSSVPTPPAGESALYFRDSDGKLCKKDSSGVETMIEGTSIAGGGTLPFFKGTNRTATAYAANTNVAYATRTDTLGGWNTTGNYWAAPRAGRYRITVAAKSNSSTISPFRIRKNGTTVYYSPAQPQTSFGGSLANHYEDCAVGDQLSIQYDNGFTTQSDGAAIDNNFMVIEWVPTVEAGIPGAYTDWTPTITAGSGAFTSVSGAGRWSQVGKTVSWSLTITITNAGTAGLQLVFTLPTPALAPVTKFLGSGRENTSTGAQLQVYTASSTAANVFTSANATPIGNGRTLILGGTYEAA